jgi:hypothetical protein
MRNRLTFDIAARLLPGQRSLIDALLLADSEEVSAAGALSLAIEVSNLSITGTVAYTLADGTVVGQRKRVQCVAAATTPLGTLTIASPETAAGLACSATFTFTAVGQAIDLRWTGTKWRCERVQRAGVLSVVVGTTVLTGLNLAHNYAMSVTGTVVSATTKGIPNGSAVGERILISNPTAASIPVGSITFTGLTLLGAAATDLQAIGATSDTAILEWTGAAWQVVYSTGITVA